MVPCQENGLHAKPGKRVNHTGAFLAQRVGQYDISGKHTIHRETGHSAAFPDMRFRLKRGRHLDPVLLKQFGVSRENLFSLHKSAYAPARDHLKILRWRKLRSIFFFAAAHNGLPKWMFGQLLCGSGQPVNLRLFIPLRNTDSLNDFRCSIGQGPGLIKSNHLDFGEPFQRVALPHEEAAPGRVSDGCHDGGRRRQYQRAWAEHNEDRDRTNDLPTDQPGQRRRAQGNHNDPGCPAVSEADNLCLARIRRLDQPDHTLNRAVLAHLGGLHFKGPELIDGAAGYAIAHGLVHGEGFAGHDRLIDGGLA